MKFHKYDEEYNYQQRPELRLYDICAEDHYIVAGVQQDKEIMVQVINEEDDVVYQEKSNSGAWDSLVSFAKMVLEQDKFVQQKLDGVN